MGRTEEQGSVCREQRSRIWVEDRAVPPPPPPPFHRLLLSGLNPEPGPPLQQDLNPHFLQQQKKGNPNATASFRCLKGLTSVCYRIDLQTESGFILPLSLGLRCPLLHPPCTPHPPAPS